MRFIDLFSGIGGTRLAMEQAGFGPCVFSSEIDDAARETYRTNFGEYPSGDITQIDAAAIPDHDVLVAGFPCQAFSRMGAGAGFADSRGTMFFEIERILAAKRPAALLLENVKGLRNHDGGRTMQRITDGLARLGYSTFYKVLRSQDFGLTQRRERIFIVGFREWGAAWIPFRFPVGSAPHGTVENIYDPAADSDPRLAGGPTPRARRSEKLDRRTSPEQMSIWHERVDGTVHILPYARTLRALGPGKAMLINGERKLSELEMLRLQGFPDSWRVHGSWHVVKKQLGNSVPVPVVRAVAERIKEELDAGPGADDQDGLRRPSDAPERLGTG